MIRAITNSRSDRITDELPRDQVLHKVTLNHRLNSIPHSSTNNTRRMVTDTMITAMAATRRTMMEDTRT